MGLDLEVVLAGLKEAVGIIRTWQGMELPPKEEKEMWNIYFNHSPEMKRIREVIRLVESNIPERPR